MAVFQIITSEDSILKQKSKAVADINANVIKLLNNMADTMYDAPGVGLAAPQIGVLKRVAVVDIGDGLIELINPRIVASSGKTSDIEGCLSVPGLKGEVERAASIVVEATNRDKEQFTLKAEGLLARALQHEIDHLDGVLFTDKAKGIEIIE